MSLHGLSAYDAAYLALAESAGVLLLTLDAGLAAAAGARAVDDGQHGLGGARALYESSLPRPSWAAHGRYLAEIRRRAAALPG